MQMTLVAGPDAAAAAALARGGSTAAPTAPTAAFGAFSLTTSMATILTAATATLWWWPAATRRVRGRRCGTSSDAETDGVDGDVGGVRRRRPNHAFPAAGQLEAQGGRHRALGGAAADAAGCDRGRRLSLALTVSECVADEDDHRRAAGGGSPAGGLAVYAGADLDGDQGVPGRAEQAGALAPRVEPLRFLGGDGGGGDASSGTLSLQLETPCFDGRLRRAARRQRREEGGRRRAAPARCSAGRRDDERSAARLARLPRSSQRRRRSPMAGEVPDQPCYSGSAEYCLGVRAAPTSATTRRGRSATRSRRRSSSAEPRRAWAR